MVDLVGIDVHILKFIMMKFQIISFNFQEEIVNILLLMYTSIYTSIPTKSTMLIKNIKFIFI